MSVEKADGQLGVAAVVEEEEWEKLGSAGGVIVYAKKTSRNIGALKTP